MASRAPYRHIAATVDAGPADRDVLVAARRMARLGPGARLSIIHVASIPPPISVGDPTYQGWLGVGAAIDPKPFLDAGRVLLERSVDLTAGEDAVLLEGYPAEAVCDYAGDEDVDLLVVGGHGGRERLALGSFSSYVGHHAPCSVMIVRRGAS